MLALAPLNVDILPDDCAVLKGLLVKLHAQYGAAIEAMHQQILKLRHAQFGASSERLSTPRITKGLATSTHRVPP